MSDIYLHLLVLLVHHHHMVVVLLMVRVHAWGMVRMVVVVLLLLLLHVLLVVIVHHGHWLVHPRERHLAPHPRMEVGRHRTSRGDHVGRHSVHRGRQVPHGAWGQRQDSTGTGGRVLRPWEVIVPVLNHCWVRVTMSCRITIILINALTRASFF